MQTIRRVAMLLVAASLTSSVLLAQDWRGKARVDGWVKDKSDQPIPEATVEFSREKGGKASTKTNKKGYWATLGLTGSPWQTLK